MVSHPGSSACLTFYQTDQHTKLSAHCSKIALFEGVLEEGGHDIASGGSCLSIEETCPVQPSGNTL